MISPAVFLSQVGVFVFSLADLTCTIAGLCIMLFSRGLGLLILQMGGTVTAQTCYYSDGRTISPDTPCNPSGAASSCCPSDAFCMTNGLCMTGGVLSRGSCTDQTWQSSECSSVCKTVAPTTTIVLTPCGDNTFACGLNTTACMRANGSTFTLNSPSNLILRQSQIDGLLDAQAEAAAASASASAVAAAANGPKTFGTSVVLAIGLCLGLLLILALVSTCILWRKLRSFKHEAAANGPSNPRMSFISGADSLGRYSLSSARTPATSLHTTPSFRTAGDPPTFQRSQPQEGLKAKLTPILHAERGHRLVNIPAPRYELESDHSGHTRVNAAELSGSTPGTPATSPTVSTFKRMSRHMSRRSTRSGGPTPL